MTKTDLSGRVAVVVGSGGALDTALVNAFSASGAKVALCCKPEQQPDTSKFIAKDLVTIFNLDLSDFASIPVTYNQVIEKFEKVDILVNNSLGAFVNTQRVPLHEVDFNQFVSVTNEWFKGLLRFSKLCAGSMGEHKSGSIVNLVSVRGMTAVADQSITVAVSAGIIGMTKMWGVEMRDYNIRANGVAVGVLEDDPELPCGNAVRFSHGNIKRPCKATEAAEAALFLASDAASYITGTVLTVDGGISAGYARSF